MARRNPGVTLLAVTTLALGVGSTTAIFSVFKAVLLNQLPYRDPSRVVALSQTDPTAPGIGRISLWTAHEWRTRAPSFASISLYGDASRTLVDNGQAETLRGLRVDHDFFDTLGIRMLMGRGFRADEDGWPRANVVILSHALWVRRFGADPGIVGRALLLSLEPFRVIGVLPAVTYPLRMSNPAEKPEIFMPMGYDPREAAACRNCLAGIPIGRLKTGIEVGQAQAELSTITTQITRAYPSDFARGTSVQVEAMRDHLVGPIQTALGVLLGAVAFVLLIACANIAICCSRARRPEARRSRYAGRWAPGAGGWPANYSPKAFCSRSSAASRVCCSAGGERPLWPRLLRGSCRVWTRYGWTRRSYSLASASASRPGFCSAFFPRCAFHVSNRRDLTRAAVFGTF